MVDKYGFPNTQHSMIDRITEGDEEARFMALTGFRRQLPSSTHELSCEVSASGPSRS